MEDIRHKLRVLTRIAAALDGRGVTWAVGASAMLYLRGLTDSFHDIDLMTAEEDADAAADVTVTCRQGDLASLLMGSCQLEGMLRLGAASADNGEAAQQLSRLLHYGQKPWLNSDY